MFVKNTIKDDNAPSNLELWVKGNQPTGGRVCDLLEWARAFVAEYGDLPLDCDDHDHPAIDD